MNELLNFTYIYHNDHLKPMVSTQQKNLLVNKLSRENDLMALLAESRLPVSIWEIASNRLYHEFNAKDNILVELETLLTMAIIDIQTHLSHFIDNVMGTKWELHSITSTRDDIPMTLYRRIFKYATLQNPKPLCFRSGYSLVQMVLNNRTILNEMIDCFDAIIVLLTASGLRMNDDPQAWELRDVEKQVKWCHRLLNMHQRLR